MPRVHTPCEQRQVIRYRERQAIDAGALGTVSKAVNINITAQDDAVNCAIDRLVWNAFSSSFTFVPAGLANPEIQSHWDREVTPALFLLQCWRALSGSPAYSTESSVYEVP